jgi:hypothetical protein
MDCRRYPATTLNVRAMLVYSLAKRKLVTEIYLRHASDVKI